MRVIGQFRYLSVVPPETEGRLAWGPRVGREATANGVTGAISFRMPTPADPGNNYQPRVVVADAAAGAATAAVAFEMTNTSAALASPRARVDAVAFEMTNTSAALASPRARVDRRGRVR